MDAARSSPALAVYTKPKGAEMSEMTRTRQALGSQIKEALDTMIDEARAVSWSMESDVMGIRYRITSPVTESLNATSAALTPGECMDWLNARGFDIRFGRS